MTLSITSSFNCFFMQIQSNIKMSYFPLVFFPQKVVCIAFIVLPFCFGPYLTLLTGNHPTSGQRELPHSFLCDTLWFSWKTQPFVVQPGSGDTSGLLYLSLWSLWEWGANWINVSASRSFNWGMLLRFKIGNKRGKGEKREENLSVQKHFQMLLDVTHKRNT